MKIPKHWLPVLLLVKTVAAQAQNTWQAIPLGTTRTLNEIEDFGAQGIVIVGDSGFVALKKTNQPWQTMQAPTQEAIVSAEAIQNADTTIFRMVTPNGYAFSIAAGNQVMADTLPGWTATPQKIKRLVNLNIVSDPQFRYGVACEGGMIHTFKTDWSPPSFSYQLSTAMPVADVFPFSSYLMLAVGDSGKVWRSTSLTNPFLPMNQTITANKLRRIVGTQNDKMWALGQGCTVLHTQNGGVVWAEVETPGMSNLHSGTVIDSTLWVCGDNGLVMFKVHGTSTWVVQETGTTQNLFDIKLIGDRLYTCGSGGTVLSFDRLSPVSEAKKQVAPHISYEPGAMAIQFQGIGIKTVTLLSCEGKILNTKVLTGENELRLATRPAQPLFLLVEEEGHLPFRTKIFNPQ